MLLYEQVRNAGFYEIGTYAARLTKPHSADTLWVERRMLRETAIWSADFFDAPVAASRRAKWQHEIRIVVRDIRPCPYYYAFEEQ